MGTGWFHRVLGDSGALSVCAARRRRTVALAVLLEAPMERRSGIGGWL
ncbi:hypothetical protein [Saliphagus sp. LR7]|nr:hypothetical protein [Saliphagus sp. LR7]